MKRNLLVLAVSGIFFLSACGPSQEELAAAEKAKQDSIAAVEKAVADSMAAAAQQQAMQDSMNAAMEQMRQDSIAMAEELAKAKKGGGKPKKKEEPKKEGSLKDKLGVDNGSQGKPGEGSGGKLKDKLKGK